MICSTCEKTSGHLGLSENRVYSQWNSHLIGIMISKTIGFRGLANIFRQTHFHMKQSHGLSGCLLIVLADAQGHPGLLRSTPFKTCWAPIHIPTTVTGIPDSWWVYIYIHCIYIYILYALYLSIYINIIYIYIWLWWWWWWWWWWCIQCIYIYIHNIVNNS